MTKVPVPRSGFVWRRRSPSGGNPGIGEFFLPGLFVRFGHGEKVSFRQIRCLDVLLFRQREIKREFPSRTRAIDDMAEKRMSEFRIAAVETMLAEFIRYGGLQVLSGRV